MKFENLMPADDEPIPGLVTEDEGRQAIYASEKKASPVPISTPADTDYARDPAANMPAHEYAGIHHRKLPGTKLSRMQMDTASTNDLMDFINDCEKQLTEKTNQKFIAEYNEMQMSAIERWLELTDKLWKTDKIKVASNEQKKAQKIVAITEQKVVELLSIIKTSTEQNTISGLRTKQNKYLQIRAKAEDMARKLPTRPF